VQEAVNSEVWLAQDGTITQAQLAGVSGAFPVVYVLDNGTVTATCQTVGTSDTSSATLTYGAGATLGGQTLIVNGKTVTFAATLASQAAMLAAINGTSGIGVTASISGTGSSQFLKLQSTNGPLTIGSGTANANLGLTAGTFTNAVAGSLLQVGDSLSNTNVKIKIVG